MKLQELFIRNDKSPKFYQYYPRLFKAYFRNIDNKTLTMLSDAGYLYYQSILKVDSIVDDKDISGFSQMLMLQEEAIKRLASIYGLDSVFWEYWAKRKKEYFNAVVIEKSLDYNNILFSDYEDLADKKSAFGKIAIDCLHLLSNNEDISIYQTLLKSHRYFSVGFQLYDDVKDFKEDVEKGQFNWAVYELKKKVSSEELNNNVNALHKLLFIRETGQEVLGKSIQYFNKSIGVLQNLDKQSEWLETVEEMRQTIVGYLDVTCGYIKTIEKKIEVKNKQPKTQFIEYNLIKNIVIRKGLDFIKSDFEYNYADLKHIMYLSAIDGFENKHEVHVSDTFQRALLNDCVISVSKNYNLDISAFLARECDYFIRNKRADDIGAWSYFSSVKEIAADIDDLGQIIQLFINSGNIEYVEQFCKKAVDIALSERTGASGGIETWIIPQKNRTKLQEKQEQLNKAKWGKGPDLEVVANFVYALFLYNKDFYKSQIEESLKYIIGQQQNNGFWESRWYYGNYYGTYVCLRLLKKINKCSEQIQLAIKAIIKSQNEDGGFSLSNEVSSDPLSTSFAHLSLKLFLSIDNVAILKAIRYLEESQLTDGSWNAVNFIKPKINEPYKSKTLTTAFALKAFCTNE